MMREYAEKPATIMRRLVLQRQALDLGVIHFARGRVQAVLEGLVDLAGEVRLGAVGQVTAVRQAHAEHHVARLAQREVDGAVGLRARVRLHVGEVGAEQLLRALDGELLGTVHEFAAAVVALVRVAFGVLVGEHRALHLQHARAGVVLGGDQLDVLFLAPFLGDGFGNLVVESGDSLHPVRTSRYPGGSGKRAIIDQSRAASLREKPSRRGDESGAGRRGAGSLGNAFAEGRMIEARGSARSSDESRAPVRQSRRFCRHARTAVRRLPAARDHDPARTGRGAGCRAGVLYPPTTPWRRPKAAIRGRMKTAPGLERREDLDSRG